MSRWRLWHQNKGRPTRLIFLETRKMNCDDCGNDGAVSIPEEGQDLCENCIAKLLLEVSAICPGCAADFSPTTYGQARCDRCTGTKKARVDRVGRR